MDVNSKLYVLLHTLLIVNGNCTKRMINFCMIPNHKRDYWKTFRFMSTQLGYWQDLYYFGWQYFFKRCWHWAFEKICKRSFIGRKIYHMRCCTHIMNFFVNGGLKDCDDLTIRVCNVVKHVRSFLARMEKFKVYRGENWLIEIVMFWNFH